MPDRKRKVFLSSTRKDLYQYRKAASEIISQLGFECSSMEFEAQTGFREDPAVVSTKWVEEADWVVLIVGWHFGTTPPDNPKSITQLEFERADQLRKPIFAYFAGSKDDPACKYSKSSAEEQDLYDFGRVKVEEMDAFRSAVMSKSAHPFRDIDHFQELLRRDIRNVLDEEFRDEAWRKWIMKMQPIADSAIVQVKMLYRLKQTHDILHHLRQEVIRQLAEVVLPSWSEGAQWPGKQMVFVNASKNCSRYIGRLEERIAELHGPLESADGENVDIDLLKAVAKPKDFGMDGSKEHPDRDLLVSDVEEFSSDVQDAFSMMNSAMQFQVTPFNDQIKGLSNGLLVRPGTLPREATYLENLTKMIDVAVRFGWYLVSILRLHNEWQVIHDHFMRIESSSGIQSRYLSDIDYFIRKKRPKLEGLYERSVEALRDDPQPDTANDAASVPLDGEEMLTALAALDPPSKELNDEASDELIDHFLRMRQHFDNVFFSYDERVLNVVYRASERATDARNQLSQWVQATLIADSGR